MPGVSEVWGRVVDADGNLLWVDRYRMAYDWERYRPNIQVEPDFKQFWAETLTQLRATPLEPVTERVKQFADHPEYEIYDVTFNGWNKQRLHAMLFVPKGRTRPLPAMVTAHPGTKGFGVDKRSDGVYGSKLKQDPRFVTIVPLIRGHAPDAQDIPFNQPWWGPLDARDTYAARAWYCAMVRAVDYLAARPELVDAKRIVVRGGSQGGALALVTTGLDPRVAVCFADCPANCQPQEIMEHYPSFGPTKGQVPPGQTLRETEKMLSYYNPVNFCPSIKCPTYVGSNIGDLTVHSMGPLAAYHNLTGLKPEQKAFYPGFTHFHGSGPGLGVKTREVLENLAGKEDK
jgi:cephalosporin-C deacetylase